MPKIDKLNKALKGLERSQGSFLNFYKWPDGPTILRILPAAPGSDPEDWFFPLGQHFNVVEKNPIACPHETNWAEDDCPICEMVKELRQNGMEDDARKYGVRRGFIIRAIIRGQEDQGAQLVRCPSTLFQAIGEMVRDADEIGASVLDVGPKGVDIRVVKSGTGLGTKYAALPLLQKQRPALPDKKAFDAIVAEFTPFEDSALFQPPSYAEIAKILKENLAWGVSSVGDSADDLEYEEGGDNDDDATPSAGGWGDDNDDDGISVGDTDDDDDDSGEGDDSWMQSDDEEDDDGDDDVDIAALASQVGGKKGRGRAKKG